MNLPRSSCGEHIQMQVLPLEFNPLVGSVKYSIGFFRDEICSLVAVYPHVPRRERYVIGPAPEDLSPDESEINLIRL